MKKHTHVTRELLDAALQVKSENELLELISALNGQERKKFFYVIELRLQKYVVENFATDLAISFKLIREVIEKNKALSAYKN
jgi:hypothetical protein